MYVEGFCCSSWPSSSCVVCWLAHSQRKHFRVAFLENRYFTCLSFMLVVVGAVFAVFGFSEATALSLSLLLFRSNLVLCSQVMKKYSSMDKWARLFLSS